MNSLPEDCVSAILSLTSSVDTCRLSVVSSAFRAAAESDVAWEKFLPCDYVGVLTRACTPIECSSKRDLFFLLSKGILIDGGNKVFALEKSSGKVSYTLSARELSILHGNEESQWNWKSIPESRFTEVAELKSATHLHIQGTIKPQTLSPNTTYAAYLIIKTSDRAFGLGTIPCETSITIRGAAGGGGGDRKIVKSDTAYLCSRDENKRRVERLLYGNRVQMMKERVNKGAERPPRERGDGWSEVEIGEFFVNGGGNEGEVCVEVMEVKGLQLKGGLIVQGIEVRPKKLV